MLQFWVQMAKKPIKRYPEEEIIKELSIEVMLSNFLDISLGVILAIRNVVCNAVLDYVEKEEGVKQDKRGFVGCFLAHDSIHCVEVTRYDAKKDFK